MISTLISCIALWIIIGLVINFLTSKKNCLIEKNISDEEKNNFITDIILGPIGPIGFIFWLVLRKINKDQ